MTDMLGSLTGHVENAPRPDSRMGRGWTMALGLYHVVVGLLILYLLLQVWPMNIGPDAEEDFRTINLFWGFLRLELYPERQLLLLVMLSGALGSYVHAATSFANFTGAKKLKKSWRWWYALRPLIGVALASGFYLATRAGFFSVSSNTQDLNLIGFAAGSFIVGMFSKQATQKLSEMFNVAFRVPPEEIPQTDKLNAAVDDN